MKNGTIFTIVVIIFAVLFPTVPAWSHTPLGGLAVAVSPDGNTVVAGGDNRVLYILDGPTLQVKKRVYMETGIWSMAFNKDGAKLLIEDTSSTIRWVNTSDWKVERELKNSGFMSAAPLSNSMAAIDSKKKAISILSMTDGSIKGSVKSEVSIATFGIDPEGKRLACLSKPQKDTTEKKVASKDIPKNLKGAEKKAFIEKNDGNTSFFFLYEIPSGKLLLKQKIFFSGYDASKVVFSGDAVIVLNYKNRNAIIDGETGKTDIFELGNSYNYGMGSSVDQKRIAGGGLAAGTYMTLPDKAQKVFRVSKIGGWPEYFKSFAFDSKGHLYGATSAYRIISISSEGKVMAAVPVY